MNLAELHETPRDHAGTAQLLLILHEPREFRHSDDRSCADPADGLVR